MTTAPDRRTLRRAGANEHRFVSARVRPGRVAAIVDISPGGVSIDVPYRLLPGARVALRLDASDGHTEITGRVLRCSIVQLGPHSVLYRAAIVFDGKCPLPFADRTSEYPVPDRETHPAHITRVGSTRTAM